MALISAVGRNCSCLVGVGAAASIDLCSEAYISVFFFGDEVRLSGKNLESSAVLASFSLALLSIYSENP